ncbi:Hydantoinase B oxoprolinase [Coniophora puteana RWD-64-598 SS2]|uniref:Hydantoinase B oxoprolinase n=1 Tax=Coniophora puteana (strain RWD-64-598) TaxID=741705 RepID=A0A5M3M8N9_CONPW|nr:Hydantoinase B oxoprolinase [Coniophora puteana RWD-64-598 SS2]EIW75632.1 Hydantoinase B oxoprolinase [Coniophora puteana RWD-64-598 SS2]
MAISKTSNDAPDPILLTLFANRFMSVAEAMGRVLQQTSISTNIKERLDFSCALFAPDGDLVANAPFIPIHLGAMSFAVKYQMKLHGKTLKPGDVLMTNSPHAGGSHLPDITIITPVFSPPAEGQDSEDPSGRSIIFFTASRGHHADIGGILPGSMPPTSTCLAEEGAEIVSFKIVDGGNFDQEGLHKRMIDIPAQYPGASGCRNIRDVESDLHAQVAANHKGVQLIQAIVDDYGLETVQSYMAHIRSNAEQCVRSLLKRVSADAPDGRRVLHAVDYLDDGTPIALKIDIDNQTGGAVLDFEGTGAEVRGNLNAPASVVHAAVIYCMRAMLGEDIPLNAGCLVPLEIKIPKKTVLAPSRTAAVCGGNVLTSQRIVDVVLHAFDSCAASQGCTNNLTFGQGGKNADGKAEQGWGYYETIAGGSGAGPGWHGTSGVHTHITNTRIGDAEILERRYPVLLHRFALRPGSGGDGEFKGGDGVIREFEFMEDMRVSILSERRTRAPYGLAGGHPAQMGRNTWIKQRRAADGDLPTSRSEAESVANDTSKNIEEKAIADLAAQDDTGPRHINVGGKATLMMGRGDRLLIETPGGGGWGVPSADKERMEKEEGYRHGWEPRGSLAERAAKQAGF